ncbi:MBL fold metallo-hydrolase [Chryseolinea sp. T2]|uniref:MBL fold metallo-hydrolase n=1 Tax=Chryseolinea sp. T2 TaxID=3129255 RepID=UPI00307817BB
MREELIRPLSSGASLKKQIDASKSNPQEDSFDIWWLGQSGFLIQWNGYCLLLDPYLSDSLTVKYANTDKPHVRLSERVIDPSLLNNIDIVTSSHNHTDHLDADTLNPLMKVNPQIRFIIPEANREFVCDRIRCDRGYPIGLNDKESVVVHPFTFFGIPSAHNEIERDPEGRCKFMGFVVRFGSFNVYHSGDTLLYEGLDSLLKPFKIDLALLPINGNVPSRRVAGNMNAEEAVWLAKEIGAALVIPHHYNMFAFNTADPELFATAAKREGQPHKVLQLGENITFKKAL